MLKEYLQINTLSVVLIGEFNPAIIQPFWLSSKGLIREQEANDTKVEVIHNELVRLTLDWLFIEVTRDRFELRTSKEPYFEPLKDLLLGIFKFLIETPISAVGINHIKHYAIPDEKRFYAIGDKLAPLANWSNIMNDPRLILLEVIEMKREDKLNGHYRVKIQPSDQALSTRYGLLISINDHYIIGDEIKDKSSALFQIVTSNWSKSFERSEEITEKLWQNLNLNI